MARPLPAGALAALLMAAASCAGPPAPEDEVVLVFPGSGVGAEAEVLQAQLQRFMAAHPGIRVVRRVTPDSADERHQLYVQWLGAGAAQPDVLQLDVIWVSELAAAGWLMPLDRFHPDLEDFFPGVVAADRWDGRTWAVPWFVDVGLLYWRTDLMDGPPTSLAALADTASAARDRGAVSTGLALQAARYEGLVTTFLEVLGGFGGRLLGPDGAPALDTPEARRALAWLKTAVDTGVVPEAALTWREEPARFAFQNGDAAFLRNWPYASALLADPARSRVAGRFALAPMPAAPGGRPTAALGGAHLAINARTRHPEAAWALVAFLTAPAQQLERARVAGQLPPRRSLYRDPRLAEALGQPTDPLAEAVAAATPRPVTPLYTALSERLQIHLHRALTGQVSVPDALRAADRDLAEVLAVGAGPPVVSPLARAGGVGLLGLLAAVGLGGAAWGWRRRGPPGRDEPGAFWFLAPAGAVLLAVTAFPLVYTLWDSLTLHDLRAPWRGRPFVGLHWYAEALSSPRVWEALGHTLLFAGLSVTLEAGLGLGVALLLDRGFRGRGLARALVLLPWALPTVVVALLFRFLFDAQAGVATAVAAATGLTDGPLVWLGHAVLAWVPVVAADVWKTTPFVALILLAGLQGIDPSLHEAARVDGAGTWARFRHITLPLLVPALGVAVLFRTLDALRVFGLIYVLTGGGPGTATEPLALTTWSALLQQLRFGYGAALGVLVFVLTAMAAGLWALVFRRGRGAAS